MEVQVDEQCGFHVHAMIGCGVDGGYKTMVNLARPVLALRDSVIREQNFPKTTHRCGSQVRALEGEGNSVLSSFSFLSIVN